VTLCHRSLRHNVTIAMFYLKPVITTNMENALRVVLRRRSGFYTDSPWVRLYMEHRLKALVQMEDGSIVPRQIRS
jgi:hypothetical protein